MTLEDVKNYIIRKNLDAKSSKRKVVDERTYLYAYLFYFLNINNLSIIGRLFGGKNHATVRSSLIKATDIQFSNSFIENTKELNSQIPIIIPEYKNKKRNTTGIPNVKKKGKEYEIRIKVSRQEFHEYARKQDPELIFDFMFRHMLNVAPRLNNSRNPYKKSIES